MRHLIFDLKYLKITGFELIIISLLFFITIWLTIKFIKKQNLKDNKLISWLIILISWLIFIGLTAFLAIPSIEKIVLIENSFLILTPLGIWTIIFISFINIFLIREIRQWLTKNGIISEKGTFTIFSFVLWLISLHFIFKTFIKNYQKFIHFQLFKIQNIEISIFDLFFVIFGIALTVLLIVLLKLSFKRLVKKGKIDEGTGFTMLNISKYIIWTFSVIIILQTIGFNLSLLLTGSAALLVGVGLGIQQLFNDFASGLILLFEQQIKVGDFVQADQVEGTVMDIGFRTTTMLTRDNIKIIIPNSKLVSDKVINWTKGEKYARIGLNVGVAYGSDAQKVKNILLKCAKQNKDIMTNPAPIVYFNDFGDSSLNFTLFFYTKKIFYRELIKSNLRFEIYKAFSDNSIEIPFPQLDVHFPDNV